MNRWRGRGPIETSSQLVGFVDLSMLMGHRLVDVHEQERDQGRNEHGSPKHESKDESQERVCKREEKGAKNRTVEKIKGAGICKSKGGEEWPKNEREWERKKRGGRLQRFGQDEGSRVTNPAQAGV